MREKVKLSSDPGEVSDLLLGGRDKEWQWVHEEVPYIDLSKGIKDYETVLKRRVDGKFFMFKWGYSNYVAINDDGLCNKWPLEGEEVFPVEKTITIYK